MTREQAEIITKGVLGREDARDRAGLRGLNRIEIAVVGTLAYEAHNSAEPTGVMAVGEPEDRGGTASGATPLSHFLTGVGACLLNQFVRVSIADGLDLSYAGARVRGEFSRDPGGRFERITTEVLAEGTLAADAVDRLVDRAEALCYVHNTLAGAVEMTTVLRIGGAEVARRVAGAP